MHRVEELADRPDGAIPEGAIPFRRLVPLEEIIAEALGMGVGTQAVEREYQNLLYHCGSEFEVLLRASEESLRKVTTPRIAEGIARMRAGRVHIEPGYDGEYGKVKLFASDEPAAVAEQQMTLF